MGRGGMGSDRSSGTAVTEFQVNLNSISCLAAMGDDAIRRPSKMDRAALQVRAGGAARSSGMRASVVPRAGGRWLTTTDRGWPRSRARKGWQTCRRAE